MVKTREHQNQISHFINNEANYAKLRKLIDSESFRFGNNQLFEASMDKTAVDFDNQRREAIVKRILENGVPTRPLLQQDVRNYFEGPVNIDLMALGAVRTVAQQ